MVWCTSLIAKVVAKHGTLVVAVFSSTATIGSLEVNLF